MLEDLSVLGDSRFRLLLIARTISVLGSSFAPVAVAFGVLGLPGATPRTLSIVLAGEAIPMVLFLLIGGVIADRFRRNRVMMVGELLNAVGFGAIAVMLLVGWTPTAALTAAAALAGIGTAVLFPALTGIIPDVVDPGHLQQGNALLGLGANIARVAGLVASGAIVVWLGAGWALVISAAMFGAAAVALSMLRPARDSRAAAGASVFADLRQGWDEFRSRQWLWVVVLQFSILVMALQAAHGVLGPVIAETEMGGAGAWAAVLAGEAIGMIFGVAIALRIRPARPILVCTLLSAAPAVPYVLLGIGAPLWMVVLGAIGMGVSFDLFGVLWQTTMQREIPPESLSRVSSYDAFGSLLFGPLGLLLAGPAAVLLGPHKAMFWCAGIAVVSALAALCAPGVRNLRAPSADRTGDVEDDSNGEQVLAAAVPAEAPPATAISVAPPS